MMVTTLDDILNDDRLARLFSEKKLHCALQLWILQVKFEQSIENRIVYSRLLPYSYSSNNWSASVDDNFQAIGQYQVQVMLLNLYVTSDRCTELIRQLTAGLTISDISDNLNLGLTKDLNRRFGAVAFAKDDLVFRPVIYLINRNAYERNTLSSPHDEAGAFSASIIQINKGTLFCLGQNYDVTLATLVVKRLNEETGLDFGGADIPRFGDLELLVFPTLNDLELSLLEASYSDASCSFVVRFNSMQLPDFSRFLFRLNIMNDEQIIYSGVAVAKCDMNGVFVHKFELSDQLHARSDSAELEIFGFCNANSNEGTLCCRWGIDYVREIHIQGYMLGNRNQPVNLDWLEKTTRPSVSQRVRSALTIKRGELGFKRIVGGRKADPWVDINRDLISLFARLYPPKSEAMFFLRWGQGDGEGRLQFVEWFKKLLIKYPKDQVVIFDPYFDSIGLNLILLSGMTETDYIVFTSIPRQIYDDNLSSDELKKYLPSRISALHSNCEQNRHLLKSIKLRIYGLKEGRLHDRYILIIGADGLPIAGFNLSNSLQSVSENYPLLLTPIPADALLMVEEYKSGLLRERVVEGCEHAAGNSSIKTIFNSTEIPLLPQQYDPLSFFVKGTVGDVLSIWTGELSLRTLSGDQLKEQMSELGLINEGSIKQLTNEGLRNCLNSQKGNFSDFASSWEVIGELLASLPSEDCHFNYLKSESSFLEFLARFLKSSFKRENNVLNGGLAVIDAQLFQKRIEALLHSSMRLDHISRITKYTALTWAEYYTIQFLWRYAPDTLLEIAETEICLVALEPQGTDVIRLSLLSQIARDISMSVQFGINDLQRDYLIRSSNDFLQWMGLNAIENQLEKPEGIVSVMKSVATLSSSMQVNALGWMVCRAAKHRKKNERFDCLVSALHSILSQTIDADELKLLVDSMRGHMRQLTWAEPWLYKNVIQPLLQKEQVNIEDCCAIWVQELIGILDLMEKDQCMLFDLAREGEMTNTSGLLFAYSNTKQQFKAVELMQAILKRQKRILQQPLARTSKGSRWHVSFLICLWILAFSKCCHYYLLKREVTNDELHALMQNAKALLNVGLMDQCRSELEGASCQIFEFYDRFEGLLAS